MRPEPLPDIRLEPTKLGRGRKRLLLGRMAHPWMPPGHGQGVRPASPNNQLHALDTARAASGRAPAKTPASTAGPGGTIYQLLSRSSTRPTHLST